MMRWSYLVVSHTWAINRPRDGTCASGFALGALLCCIATLAGCIPIGAPTTVSAKPSAVKVGKTTRAEILRYRYFQFPNATTPDGRFFFYRYHKGIDWELGIIPLKTGIPMGTSYHGHGVFVMEYDNKDVVKNVVIRKCDADTPSICALGGDAAMWRLIGELLGEGEAAHYRASLVPVSLHQAVIAGKTEEVKRLLGQGVPVNTRDDDNRTALMIAADRGDQALVELLIAHGAEVRVRSAEGDTPLIDAAEGGDSALIALLLASDAEVNAKNNFGDTALIRAAIHGRTEAATVLLANGALIDEKDNGGWTALHWAAFQGHAAVVKLLLDEGADVAAKTQHGRTALQVAAQRGHNKIIELLRQSGAKE
jgi:hypothetical protein